MSSTREERLRMERKLALRRKRIISRRIGLLLTIIQLLLSLLVSGMLIYLNLLPSAYLAVGVAVLLFFVIFCFLSQFTSRRRFAGKFISVIISILLISASYYLVVTTNVLTQITGKGYKTETISVYVLKEDSAQSIADCSGYIWGYQTLTSEAVTNQAFDEIKKNLASNLDTAAYTSFNSLVSSLYNMETNVILINDSHLETIKDYYPDFTHDTRILTSYTIRTKVDISTQTVKVSKEPFIVYVSGIDVYGDISQTSRSDVNIIAVVNPNTKKVLLVSAPRDSYVELPVERGAYDKLTHAGNYGVETSMQTLANLYGVDINYYLRVNFTGFMNIVDALGGITIENEESFVSNDGYYFEEGTLELDGLHALHYARERKAFALGDVQRGINQMKVIKAMAAKAMSPTLLTNYSSIMESIADCMQTNMAMDDISSLVKMQLKDNSSWDISTAYLGGSSASMTTYSYPDWESDVYLIDNDSLSDVKAQIQQILKNK